MKKFMKALALALALCMVLSVSALAVGKSELDIDGSVIDFTVTGLAPDEMVALMVLVPGTELEDAVDNETILYLDQTVADGSGEAAFEATIKEGITNVDVWVGSESINDDHSGAWKAYPNISVVAPVSSVTLSETKAKILNVGDRETLLNGEEVVITRPGAAIGIVPKDVNLIKMIWALKNESGAYKFSNAIDIELPSVVEGEVWFTGVFTSAGELANFTIKEVAAIFLDADGETEYFMGIDPDTALDLKKPTN